MDFEALRKDFPVLDEWVYLDNAFVGLMPRQVREGHLEYIDAWHRFRTTGDNTILQDWLAKTGKVRGMVADLIGATPAEIAFTTCTGSGLNIAVNGLDWNPGDNVVFPEWEHNPLYTNTTARHGVESRPVPVVDGKVELTDLENRVDDHTRLVQVSQVGYINGHRFNLREVADIAHEHGAKLLVDATQAVGAVQVDYRADDVDFVSVAPYKYLMGPTGLAFLYVSRENIPLLTPDRTGWKNQIWAGDRPEDPMDLESAEKFEYGTLNFEGMYALERSLALLGEVGMDRVERRVLETAGYLYDRLVESGKKMYTPERPRSPIVSYYQTGAVEQAAHLKALKVKVTGREAHGGHMRVSVHFYNNRQDIDTLMENVS